MFLETTNLLTRWFIPSFLLAVFLYALYKRVPIFDVFVEGAQEGFGLMLRLIPYVLGMYVAIAIFRSSGAMDILSVILSPVLRLFQIPPDVIPLALIRSLSGPASLGLTADLMQKYGPDSFVGRLAANIEASNDTTFYVIALYLGSVGIRKAGYSFAVCLLADLAATISAILITAATFTPG